MSRASSTIAASLMLRRDQYLRVWMYCLAVSMVNTVSSTTMRFGIGRPATTSATEVISCGPSSGLHSMVTLSLPAIMASNAPFTASIDTMKMSLPGFEAGFLDGLDGADGHVVVVRVQHVDLARLGLEEGLHDFLALGAREIAGLRADDLQMRIRGDDFLEALLAIDGRRRTDRALQLDDVHVVGGVLERSLTQRPALRPSSTKSDPMNPTYSDGSLGDGAVGEDHGNLRGLGFPQHRVPAGFDHRRKRDHIDLLRDEGAQRLDLVFLLLLRVGESAGRCSWCGGGLDGFGVRRAPFALGADLAEAEHDAFVLLFPGATREEQVARGTVSSARRENFIVFPSGFT